MIPKIIHYCWFGKGEKSDLLKHCISTWRKFCPDYQIIEWNENNFDFNIHPYSNIAYKNKKWAFVSDYARLKIIYENGGIYLDTDVELLKNLDFLRRDKFFCGFELQNFVNTGIGFGAEKKLFLVQKMLEEYDGIHFINPDGKLNTTPCTFYNSKALSKLGVQLNNTFQKTDDFTIYPTEFFSPKSYESGIIKTTKKTVSIHHFNSSWEELSSLNKKKRQHKICKIFGEKLGLKIILILDFLEVIKNKGFYGTVKSIIKYL